MACSLLFLFLSGAGKLSLDARWAEANEQAGDTPKRMQQQVGSLRKG
jgi:hypothetical protein